ncbi:hypothetical protein I0C86_15315 [Plantactinospora sp. S1510]|uniref:Uncharacterized protein n=1 Tax=Plantactinospora alkalitolerans TaxID=2789879 RepID=A0ABS0GWK6_9ACTN|nr:hypothetical protein [Plantactinospora alkalitolerans]MBF9130314.1 hypothetical protein [Plantactinospora alkalitolerans]
MTSPGARGAQQAYQQQVQNNSATFRRNAAYDDQRRYRGRQRGPIGAILRLFGFLFSLVIIAIAIGIFLMILGAIQPDWIDQLMSLFDQI